MRAARKKVSCIGIGAGLAPSLLYSYILSHPEFGTAKEATNFFSSAKAFARGLDWYEAQFEEGKGKKVYGELVSEYIQYAPAAGLIARTLPDARLLAVIENPLLAVRVAYVEARKNNLIPASVSLAQFLKDSPEVLQSARHGRHLTQFFSYYAPTDLLVLTADEVRDEPIKVIKQTYEHIGVDDKFVPMALQHLVEDDDSDQKKKPGLLTRLFRKIKAAFAKIHHVIVMRVKPPIVPVEMAFMVARKIPLSPELESFLKEYYKEDVAVLSRLLHRSFTHEWEFEV